jgi:hypothetical protein
VNERMGVSSSNERHREQSVDRSRKRSTIVFSGDAERVSAGFALALAVMEAHENLLITNPESDPKGD